VCADELSSYDFCGRGNSMLSSPRRCRWTSCLNTYHNHSNTFHRFTDCEKWRSEFGGGVDELTKNFKYDEKPKVFEYYPQYYHKTDKVCGLYAN